MVVKKIRHSGNAIYKALGDMIHHDGVEHAGYLAFLSLLSFFPFLVFFVAVAGFIGNFEIGNEFVSIVLNNLPSHVESALLPRIDEIISGPPQGLMTLSIVGAIWTSSSSVEGLRTVLNRAMRVHSPPPYITRRMLSIVQFLAITAIILIAMLILIFFPVVIDKIPSYIKDLISYIDPIWGYIKFPSIFITLFVSVCLIFYLIPNSKMSFRVIMPGAFLVVILWVFSAMLLAKYLKNFQQVNLIYGSIGGIIASLVFFYIINLILIFGAEFNYHFHKIRS
jgi:membrane protein